MSITRSKVYLEEIRVNGYRSCRGTHFHPNSKLSALIGINGAGKTNILNAISLLAPQYSQRWYKSGKNDDSSSTQTEITAWFVVGDDRVGLKLRLTFGATSSNEDDILKYEEMWSFPSYLKTSAWKKVPPFIRTAGPHSFFEDDVLLREVALKRIKMPKDWDLWFDEKITKSINDVNEFRAGIKYYSAAQFTDPTRCPTNFEIDSDKKLERTHRSPRGHLTFLYDLYSLKQKNPDLYEEYTGFISKGQLGLISRLSWKEIPLSSSTVDVKSGGKISKVKKYKTLVIPTIQIGMSHITFNQLSEGTFKTLALIFYVMTDSGSCLLIEEPEVCVHHGLLAKIINTISAYSNSKQVMFSTHSDAVLDTLSNENVFIVQMQKTGSVVSKLSKWLGARGISALNAYLDETGTLGEYWRSGGFSS